MQWRAWPSGKATDCGFVIRGFDPRRSPTYKKLKRATGIEPVSLAWKAKVLPLYDARNIINKVTRESLFVNKLHSK